MFLRWFFRSSVSCLYSTSPSFLSSVEYWGWSHLFAIQKRKESNFSVQTTSTSLIVIRVFPGLFYFLHHDGDFNTTDLGQTNPGINVYPIVLAVAAFINILCKIYSLIVKQTWQSNQASMLVFLWEDRSSSVFHYLPPERHDVVSETKGAILLFLSGFILYLRHVGSALRETRKWNWLCSTYCQTTQMPFKCQTRTLISKVEI